MRATLRDLEKIGADSEALTKDVAALQRQVQKFQLLNLHMEEVLTAVSETLELLGHTRQTLTNIGEAAQVQQIMETRQNAGKRES